MYLKTRVVQKNDGWFYPQYNFTFFSFQLGWKDCIRRHQDLILGDSFLSVSFQSEHDAEKYAESLEF